MARSSRGTFLIVTLVILLIVFIVILSTGDFSFKKTYDPGVPLSEILPRYRLINLDEIGITTDFNKNGNNDLKDIVIGAKAT